MASSRFLLTGGATFIAKQSLVGYPPDIGYGGRVGGGVAGFFRRVVDLLCKVRRPGHSLVLALVVVGLVGGSSSAQELTADERAQLQAQKDELFQKTLRDPGNLDITFAYADVAAKLGDNEAAVSALERMLLFNPNLPRVQVELGALYFRMGSYDISRTYFDRALAANPPDEVKKRIESYLAQIARLNAPQRYSGFFFFGVQHQSDANIAGSSSIAFPGIVINLLPQFVKRSDFDVFGTGSVLYSYDLGNQDRDTLEVGGTGYAKHYSRTTRLDLGFVEATVGPRFNYADPLPSVSSLSLKPYLIANDVSLGGNQYFDTGGFGGEATALAWDDVRLKSVFEFRQKSFSNAPDRPLSTGFNGSDKIVALSLTKPIAFVPQSELSLEFDFLNQDTAPLPELIGPPLPYYSNNTFTGAMAYHIRYDDPTRFLRLPWDTTFSLSHSWANYVAPDPCCGVASNRFDQRWRFAITQSFQIGEATAIVMQVQRDVVSSNEALYHYTNNSVLVGPQFRF